MPGEGAGDPAGGGEESTLSGCVLQEAAGSRAAGLRGPGGDIQPWQRGCYEAATEAAGKFPFTKAQCFLRFSIYCLFHILFYMSQGQMKEVLRELDETKLTREEVISQFKDSEKKIQTLEAEVLQLSEVCWREKF